jgi:Fe-S-cluster-containing hydrogenase component 2
MKLVIVEQDRCLACRNCERVCSFQESGGFKRENASIWVHVDLDARSFFTLTCQQCDVASCMNVCPSGALKRDALTGAVVVDEALCLGCKMCVNACPFGCIFMAPGVTVAAKCDLCRGNPKCVQNCMAGALHYADINTLAERKRRKVEPTRVYEARPGGGEERE